MKLSALLQDVNQNAASVDGKKWYPVRPMTAENTFLKYRIKAAWRVLIGASDAVEWDYPPDDDGFAQESTDNQCRKIGCTNPAASPVLAFCKEHCAPPAPFA